MPLTFNWHIWRDASVQMSGKLIIFLSFSYCILLYPMIMSQSSCHSRTCLPAVSAGRSKANVLPKQHWEILISVLKIQPKVTCTLPIPLFFQICFNKSDFMQLFVLLDFVISKFRNTINLVLKFSECDDLFDSSHGAVINDGRLLSTAAFNMTIHSIVAHV